MSKFDTAELRRIAVEVEADPRTVRKILAGKKVRGVLGRRLHRELERRGYLDAIQVASKERSMEGT